jgi:hypothetical protein
VFDAESMGVLKRENAEHSAKKIENNRSGAYVLLQSPSTD